MRRTLIALTALALIGLACDSITGWDGPLGFGVESGRDQTVQAGGDMEPAVARVWTDPNGVAHFGVGSAPLYAQTSVQGVEGAVVCVGEIAIEGEPIVPHSRCTATESDGRATFHMTPSTRAGRHRTPIVAEYNGEALTPDTVTAQVEPGPPVVQTQHGGYVAGAGPFRPYSPTDTLWWEAKDEYDNTTRAFTADVDHPGLTPVFAGGRGGLLVDTANPPTFADTFSIDIRTPDDSLIVRARGRLTPYNITDTQADTTYHTWAVLAEAP